MLKFREIGTYKNAVNIGYCTATKPLKNGMVVTVDEAKKQLALPSNGQEDGLAIVMNVIDKPETLAPNDYEIEVGENARVFTLESLKGRIIQMDMDQVVGEYASIEVGTKLCANAQGKLEVQPSVEAYKAYFEVTNKTGFNGEGLEVKVVIA